MKKFRLRGILCLSLALTVLFACASADTAFTYRSGITWDTTPSQMLAAEGLREGDESFNQQDYNGLTFFFLKTEGIYYVFRGEQPIMAYSLPPQDVFLAELERLTALYGAPADVTADTVATLLNLVIPDSAESGDISDLAAWRLSDGTLAAMFTMDSVNFQIYFHEPRISGGQ